MEIPEKDILKQVTINYSTNSKIDANTNDNNTNQKINSSDTSTTKVLIVGELINNSVINKCHLCEKTVKSSNGLKLHLRSCKKKISIDDTNTSPSVLKTVNINTITSDIEDIAVIQQQPRVIYLEESAS